ncbi:hypothetical protein VTO42DRAFT_1024 [Malbranchea cinnamomea]
MKFPVPHAAILASLALSVAAQKITEKGCYNEVDPPLEDIGILQYNSHGACQQACLKRDKPVMALWGGSNCFCGDELPPDDQKTSDDKCDVECQGFPDEICGGMDAYGVFLTGKPGKVPVYSPSSSSSSTSTSSAESTTSSSSQAPSVTSTDADSNGGGGPNVAGIAAGVVVGVVAIAALVGGGFFYMKYRKRKELVDEYRRNATISSFVAGGKPFSESSMSDSRLEPSMMSQRRQSNGSIADDQDFSRRILKVTNPDSYY